MGELILCEHAMAGMPYFLESVSLNVYSLEELAFCMKNQTYFTGTDVMEDEFVSWVDQELHMKDLAKTLNDLLEKNTSLNGYISCILDKTNYCSLEEKKKIQKKLLKFEDMSSFECDILRADGLLENEKYLAAIRAYEHLLEDRPKPGEEYLLGKIWHNLGTAYGRLFFFEKAQTCFEKAFSINQDPVSEEAAFYAGNFQEKSDESMDPLFLDRIKRMHEAVDNDEQKIYDEMMQEQIKQWKNDYMKYSRI